MRIIIQLSQALLIAILVVGSHALLIWSALNSQAATPPPKIEPPRPIQVSLITPEPPPPPAATPPPPKVTAPPPPKVQAKPPPPKKAKPKPKPKPKPKKVKAKPKPKPKPRKVVESQPPKVAPKPVATTPSAPVRTAQVSRPVPPAPRAAPPAAKPAPPARVTQPRFNAGYLNNPPPKYPRVSKRRGEEGVVSLRVKVSPQGRALEVKLNRSSGSNRLDKAAQKTVKKWRFVPAKRGDTPITAWVIVPIHFKLEK